MFYNWKYKIKPRHKQEGHYARQTLLLVLNHSFCDSAKYKLQNQKQQKRQNKDLTHTQPCNIWKYSHYSMQFHHAISAVFWRQTKGQTHLFSICALCFMCKTTVNCRMQDLLYTKCVGVKDNKWIRNLEKNDCIWEGLCNYKLVIMTARVQLNAPVWVSYKQKQREPIISSRRL